MQPESECQDMGSCALDMEKSQPLYINVWKRSRAAQDCDCMEQANLPVTDEAISLHGAQ